MRTNISEIWCYGEAGDLIAKIVWYADGEDSRYVVNLHELELVEADELQQIVDKLRELNGGQSDD